MQLQLQNKSHYNKVKWNDILGKWVGVTYGV